ncbi:MAG: DMT family transporter [Pseudomonadota bacterium]
MSTPSPSKDSIPLAVGIIVTAVFAMSIGDMVVKVMGTQSQIGMWQLFALRSALLVPLLLAVGLYLGLRGSLLPQSWHWVSLRSLLLVLVWVAYYAALPHMPFAAAAAALYTLPLFMVAFSALWTHDTVTPLQGVAALLGFVGVGLILRPGGDAFTLFALLPVLGAALFAFAMVLTRVHCKDEHPLALAFSLHGMFVVLGALGLIVVTTLPLGPSDGFMTAAWQAMDQQEWLRMALLAAMLLVASVGTAMAYQKAPISIVGTFEFSYVGFATIWGFLFFAERPDLPTFAGLILITAAGILAVRR